MNRTLEKVDPALQRMTLERVQDFGSSNCRWSVNNAENRRRVDPEDVAEYYSMMKHNG